MTDQHEQYDEVERVIMTSYRLMNDYRVLEEPELVTFHERNMNVGLQQWSDLHKYLGRQATAEAIHQELTETGS